MDITKSFSALLRLYPRNSRVLFEAEMRCVFTQALGEKRRAGPVALARFLASEFLGLFSGAGAQWMLQFTSKSHVPGGPAEGASLLPAELTDAEKRAAELVKHLVHAIAHHQFQEARAYAGEESAARRHLEAMRAKYGIAG